MVNNIKVSITDVITELNVTDNKIEFMNDLNLFLNIVAFIGLTPAITSLSNIQ